MALRGIDWDNGVIEIDAIYSKFNNEISEEARAALNLVKNEMAGHALSMETEEYYHVEYVDGESFINEVLIPNNILEEVEFSIVERVEEITNIEEMKCEARQSGRDGDVWMMESDLDELRSLKDKYILSSIATNEYLSHSGTPGSFAEKCEEILSLVKNTKTVSAQ